MILFLLSNWRLVAFAATIAVLSATAGFYKWQANRWEAKYETFVVETRAAGIAAEVQAKETKARDEKAKEVADAKREKSIAVLRADNQRLRDERAGSVYVPAAAPGARDPETACFTRADLERALSGFVEGAAALVGEGDEARLDLDNARAWAQR